MLNLCMVCVWALQGNHCWCGAESDLSGTVAKAKSKPLAQCKVTPCHADKAQKCGGTNRLLVYAFNCTAR